MQGPNRGMRPTEPPPRREVWCEEHHRPAGPDGRCSLCVEGDDPARSERRVVLVVVAIALLGGIGPAAYYFFWARHEEDRNPGARAGKASAMASKDKGRTLPMAERWVDEETPPMDVMESPREKARRERRERRTARTRKRARRRHARRGSGRATWAGPVATDKPRPRSAGRVPITMYMAHW